MISAIEQLQKLGEQRQRLSKSVRDISWNTLSPQGMHASLEESLEGLREIKNSIAHLSTLLEMQNVSLDSASREESIELLLNVLQRNARFEREKKVSSNEEFFVHSEKGSELYSSLQEKVLNELDSVHHFLQRAEFKIREKGFSPKTENASKTQALAAIQRQLVKETFPVNSEKEWRSLSSQLERELDEVTNSSASLNAERQRVEDNSERLKELFQEHSRKTTELLETLKKEKEDAVRQLLDGEKETQALRDQYVKGITETETRISTARDEIRQKYAAQLHKLEVENVQKDEYLQHFKTIAEEKEAENRKLREERDEWKMRFQHLKKFEHAKKRLGKK